MLSTILVVVLLNLSLALGLSGNGEVMPVIPTPWGQVLGSTMTTRLNKTIYAFRGIKYANAARFEDPVMVPKWNDVYNATYDRPMCPQPTSEPVAEDCLHLNVFTKEIPESQNQNPRLPVIVFLHPGGFYAGTGHSDWYGPQYLMDKDVVLVTLNYRLGALGFLSTGTKDATGNYALKDQVVALQWIKENIAAFGGDPDSVTLLGCSAGAFSINMHMVSPMTKGKKLFHKAILSSGSVLGHHPLPNHQLKTAQKQARIMGCPDDTPANIVKCLKTKSAEEIGKSVHKILEVGPDGVKPWYPVIEPDFGQKRYLTENPLDAFRRGDFDKIPVVQGQTKDEFGYAVYWMLGNETLANYLNKEFDKYAPILFVYENGTEKTKEVTKAVKQFYFHNEPVTNNSFTALAKLVSDSVIGYPVYRSVNLISQNSPQPVYYYKFAYHGRYSTFYIPNTNNETYGVVHHDDLIYLLYTSRRFPIFDDSYPEAAMVERLTTMWTNFAKTGNPIPKATPELQNATWPPYNKSTRKYMNMCHGLVVQDDMFQERFSFWESLYPINE